MKDYLFEVAIYKSVKADNLDRAKEYIDEKTKYINECKKLTLLEVVNERN